MTELLTAAQMKAIEQAAIDAGEVTGLELMERAGQGVVEAVMEEWPELAEGAHRAVVLCGPGNNGGDGFVVARLLKARGWEVEVFLYGDPGKLPPDAKVNYHRLSEIPADLASSHAILMPMPDLVFDALFGTGLGRPIEGDLAAMLDDISNAAPPWDQVAIDIPTGINSDTGQVMGSAFRADLTVTFHRAKLGHHFLSGPEYCGKIIVWDIGL